MGKGVNIEGQPKYLQRFCHSEQNILKNVDYLYELRRMTINVGCGKPLIYRIRFLLCKHVQPTFYQCYYWDNE